MAVTFFRFPYGCLDRYYSITNYSVEISVLLRYYRYYNSLLQQQHSLLWITTVFTIPQTAFHFALNGCAPPGRFRGLLGPDRSDSL
jgi:hypothetical protein